MLVFVEEQVEIVPPSSFAPPRGVVKRSLFLRGKKTRQSREQKEIEKDVPDKAEGCAALFVHEPHQHEVFGEVH